MSKDMQNAVNNFVVGFSLGDRVMARHDAAAAAAQKWQTMLQWRMADLAEKAKRNASYDARVKQQGDLMAAQADWYRRRGAGGGAKVSIGSSGKPAFSPADQAFIDKQVAAGGTPPAAQGQSSPTVNVEMPDTSQPPPFAPIEQPPNDSGNSDATTGALFNEARGGMVPKPRRFQNGGAIDYSSTGVGGTSGPGSGYGVRAAPPSYQTGGRIKRGMLTPEEISEREQDALIYEDPRQLKDQQSGGILPYREPPSVLPALQRGEWPPQPTRPTGGGAGATTEPDVPYADAPQRNASGTSYASEPDVPPQAAVARRGGGGRGAVDTRWKRLGDQTRTKAYDPTLDAADPRNIGIIDATGRVNQQAYRASPMVHPEAYPAGTDQFTSGPDYSARWNSPSIFSGTGETYRRGGPVRRFAFGGPTGGSVEDLNYARPVSQGGVGGGSANAATGSGGDSTGGVSGTGGVGGSASDDAGGSAAAGVSGDDGGTYRRGGRVGRRGAISTRYQRGGPVQQGDDEDDRVPPTAEERQNNEFIVRGRDAGDRMPVYGTGDMRRKPNSIGPRDDFDFEPPRSKGFQPPRYLKGGAVDIPEGRSPVPRVRDNLPPVPTGGDVDGHEVPPEHPMEWYERANPRTQGGGSLKQGPWENPPLPPPGIPSRDVADLAALHRAHPELYSDPAVRLPQYGQDGDEASGAGPTAPTKATGRSTGTTEPVMPPQESRPPVRSAINTARWKGLQDQTRVEAYDPTKDDPIKDRADNTAQWKDLQDQTRVEAYDPTKDPAGPYNVNVAGAGPNNAHNDFTPIMKAASDFAGHVFHLTANDEHTAGGYHALMAGHGAAPINLIEAGFQKIDPQGRMPIPQKMEMLSEHLYDYYVSQKDPVRASKVAFEVGQFGNVMAKKQAAQAGDLLQGGDFNGAMTHLTAGYNWLVDGHSADYDPHTRMITLRDSKSGQVTGQIPATPQLIEQLQGGMSSGELNWDIMRGRGSLPHPGAPPPGAQAPPQGPPSGPAVQPAAAPAGPPQQPPAAPPLPPQGDGGPPGSPAGNGPPTQVAEAPPQAVQPAPPPNLAPTRNTVITSTPPPPGPSNRSAQPQRAAPTDQPSTPTQTKKPAQGDQSKPEEGSDEWYADHPFDIPKGDPIRRRSLDPGPQPETQAAHDRINIARKAELDRLMTDAAHGNLSQSGKSTIPQFMADINKKYDKAEADLEARQKEWTHKEDRLTEQEERAVKDRQVQSQSSETNLDGKFDTILDGMYQKYAKLDPVKESKVAREQLAKPGGRLDDQRQLFTMVHQSPLRYMRTPADRARLKEIATAIWSANPVPPMSERQALEHALAFTSYVPDGNKKGANQNSGAKGTWYKRVGYDPLRNIVVENQSGTQVHMPLETMKAIEQERLANYGNSKDEDFERTRLEQIRAAQSKDLLQRSRRFLGHITPKG